ncbi:MAG TPA: hypothetical protein VMN38_10570 [Sphingomicrobium sp.]|nr:hypothetical protein [Sphingomicrobium sp.]
MHAIFGRDGLRHAFGGPLIRPERYGFFDRLLFAVFVLFLPPLLASKPGLFDDGDVSWHVAAGRWILANGRVPDTDPFSFTMAGQPWVAHEWLAEIVYAVAFNAAGYAGLAAVVAAALMVLHLTVFLHLRSRVGPIAMLVAFAAMDLILAKFLLARPHVLVWPLLAIWTSLLLRARDQGRTPPNWLALQMLVWTNLHGSFALGFIVAGAIALDALVSARWKRPIFFGWLNFGLLALIAALFNLNGLPGLLHPLAIMGMNTLHLINEWNPGTPSESPLFYLVFVPTLAAMFLRGVKLRVGETALLLLMLMLAFMQIRHQSWLAIVAVMVLTPYLAGTARGSAPPAFATQRERRTWLGGALAIAIALFVARLLLPLQPEESAGTPRGLIAAIPAELRSQPVLNEYSFGGPLILAGVRPYIDGRADMYGDEFFRDYSKIVNVGDFARFERAARRYGIRWTMLPHHVPLAKAVEASPDWRRIYSDKIGIIHVRRPVAGAGGAVTRPSSPAAPIPAG